MAKPRLTGVVDRADFPALRSLDIEAQNNDKVYVPGQGFFDWDAASTAADDGATVIKPDAISAAAAGRWVKAAGSGGGFKYSKEWHVDPVNGLDTNDGSEDKPFKTVARAQTAIVGSGDALYLHAGTYTESVNWTDLNVDIIGASTGGLTNLAGLWSFQHTSSSVRVRNVSFTGGFSHSTNGGALYLNECQCPATFMKIGAGYLEVNDSDFGGTGFSVDAAGLVNLVNTKVTGLTVNNSTAAVNVQGSTNLTAPVLLAGSLAVNGSTIFSASGNGNAVTSSPGTTLLLRNCSLFTPQGTSARLGAGGFYSLDDVLFDSANSNFAGTNLGAVAHFDALTAINKVAGSSLSVPWSLDKAFDAAVIVEKDGALYKSNAAIPKNTPFAVGTAGATWRQVGGASLTTTSLLAQVYTAGSYVNAQANNLANVADLVLLSDGSRIDAGKVTWAAHGLTVGAYYFLSDTTPGTYTATAPASIKQRLFFVEDANTIHVNVEPAETIGAGDPRVYYQTSSTTLPTVASAGDELLISSTGNGLGAITEQWIYDGSMWVQTAGATPVSGSVLDNTIANPASITTVGRYIVPATGTSGVFVGQENKYADWDGTTFTFSAPATNATVQIASGSNAGQVWRYSGTVWSVVTQTTGLPIYNWVQANAYKTNDLVIYNNTLYRANGSISPGSLLILGSTGATWSVIDSRDVFNVYVKKDGIAQSIGPTNGDYGITGWQVHAQGRNAGNRFNTSTGIYTVPFTGWYSASFAARSMPETWTAGVNEFTAKIQMLVGSTWTTLQEALNVPSGSGTYSAGGAITAHFYATVGTQIRAAIYHNRSGASTRVDGSLTYLSIAKIG